MGKETLIKAEGEYKKAQTSIPAGQDKAPTDDCDLDNKRKDRSYNPIDEAERGSISQKLNEDSGRYRKGPGPF